MRTFAHPCAFESIHDLKDAVRDARSAAEREARRDCGPGWLFSRGAWVIGRPGNGHEHTWGDGLIPFEGTYKQMDKLIADAMSAGISEIYIEGGFNWSASLVDYCDNYEPWVSEWSILVWSKKEHVNA